MLPSSQDGEQDVARILSHLAESIGDRRYRSWFEGKTQLILAGDELIVTAGSPYLINWIQKSFVPNLQQAVLSVLGSGLRLRFEVDAKLSLSPSAKSPTGRGAPTQRSVGRQTTDADSDAALDEVTKEVPPSRVPLTGERRLSTLADFVVGDCNQLARTAAQQVADAPGSELNPLYLYGGVGNGKTHLLEGICRQIKRNYPSLQVILLTAETFANCFTTALRERSLPSFRQRFRNCDVLLVDDVDFLEGKKGIQEEFLHTIQQLESHGRQVVMTGDRHPRMTTRLSEELVTRCLSGMVCRIDPPTDGTRKEFVKRFAARLRVDVTDGALDFVASRFTRSVRELAGAMNCLNVWRSIHGKRVGITAAREVLTKLERDCRKVVRMPDVETAVCQMFGVSASDLRSSDRSRSLAQPRMLAMYLARRLTPAAYSEIGQYFGGRNHSTVVAAERRMQKLIDDNESLRVSSETWSVRDIIDTLGQQIRVG
ncbi:MAG: chromosomal replication initiator protein DnaA [Planctomycetaceae bacterium]